MQSKKRDRYAVHSTDLTIKPFEAQFNIKKDSKDIEQWKKDWKDYIQKKYRKKLKIS
jgi:hypothetical protein